MASAPSATTAGVGTPAGDGTVANDSAVAGESTVTGGGSKAGSGVTASDGTEASARLTDAESAAERAPLSPRRLLMPGEAMNEHRCDGFTWGMVFHGGGNGH